LIYPGTWKAMSTRGDVKPLGLLIVLIVIASSQPAQYSPNRGNGWGLSSFAA
jgi:hypothetical protein